MDYQQRFNNGVRPSCIRIRILVVDDQYTSLNLATTTLRSLNYEVLTAKHPFEALSTLRLMQGGIDLVISDYHMPDMNGVQLQKQIHEQFKIPVIMMSVDSREFVVLECLRGGSKVFWVKPIKVEQVENVWQYVVANKKGKSPSVGIDRVGNYLGFQDPTPFLSYTGNMQQQEEGGNNKNHKVIWTNALHTLFLQAINQIGLDKAVPKKILDRMNVPGLTRQHVASHLQKYRKFLKKVAERGLVKCDDPEKAVNEAFEMTMASNGEYHDMILSMPPSQFGRCAQPNLGSSSSSVVGNIDQLANPFENSSSCSYNYNGVRMVHGNEHHQFPARLGLNSSNHHIIPSRLGLSSPYKSDEYEFDTTSTRVDLDSTALVFHNNNNNNWMNLIDQPNTSGHAYGDPPSNVVTNYLHQNCASNPKPYVQDKTTLLPPPPPNITLGDDLFDSLSKLLLLPQGDGDIDKALQYAPHLLDEEPITTNETEDEKWDDDFINSLLVDDEPYMEANEPSC